MIAIMGASGNTGARISEWLLEKGQKVRDVAAEALTGRNWTGVVVRELLGQCDLTYAEATRIIGPTLASRI